jgi:hypothetical protein
LPASAVPIPTPGVSDGDEVLAPGDIFAQAIKRRYRTGDHHLAILSEQWGLVDIAAFQAYYDWV